MKTIYLTLLVVLFTGSTLSAAKAKAAPAAAQAAAPVAPAAEEKEKEKIPKKSAFRLQIGFVTGVQAGPIGSNSLIQKDVDSMTSAVNAANLAAPSGSPPAAVTNMSAVTYAVPLGLSLQTVLFDFFRIRVHATYDIPIPTVNEYTDTSSGATKTFRSDIRVSQLQVPLLFMFDIPVGRENNIYLGGGPTLYWGTIEKTISETNKNTGVSLNDTDRLQGFAYGPTFIIGIQRRLSPAVSLSADFLYQMGARGGFKDKHENDASNNNPTGFSDLNGNSGSEKNASDGKFNDGTPKIMNYEGVRFLLSLNLHLDF
ncbi:MAG: hypothetical protein JNJ69_10590 [Leptospiraceae bacterium]|nr:hypothetical protein [Leptospiraceae bacterium]